ncbi:hypothetical protein O4H61_03385 [Roseovarius aestuarii]|nr:hypothetical protein [Roseovarius aestuarii]
MIGNRSSAVRQQRHEPHDSLDDFPTPPWATRALCEWLKARCMIPPLADVREPAANRGHMARVLGEYFARVHASDIHDYGVGYPVCDYLFGPVPERSFWVITNPPFKLALAFIERARASAGYVAMIVRSAFLEGGARYRDLFADDPPRYVLQFCERVVMHKGCLSEHGSTATAYCWLIWTPARGDMTQLDWIPPGTRKRLERAGDYPAIAVNPGAQHNGFI